MEERASLEHLKSWARQMETAGLPAWGDLPDLPLYMDQVILLLGQYLPPDGAEDKGVTASIVNNYVRMKVMPAPVKKKYSRVHLAYLIMICTLKQSLSIASIQKLIPPDLEEAEVRALYGDFTSCYQGVLRYFCDQVQGEAQPLFHLSEERSQPLRAIAVGTALIANLAQDMTEEIIRFQGEAPT